MYETLFIEKEKELFWITVNRPNALNALNTTVLNELYDAFMDFANDEKSKVAILTGSGKSFVAGADISAMSKYNEKEGYEIALLGHRLMNYIESINKPVIAAINGFALGGGCELAMACDIRIASEKAKFGQPEVNLGITPGFGGTQRLGRLVGTGMARYLIMSGEMIDSKEALRIGLVEKVVTPESLLDQARSIASLIGSKAPIAVGLSKQLILEGYDLPMGEASDLEASVFGKCFQTQDQKEGMNAFLEKRNPGFKNK